MITAVAWYLTVCLSSGCFTVQNIPDEARCRAMGAARILNVAPASKTNAKFYCDRYDVLVVSSSGTLPEPGKDYLLAR